MKNDGGPAFPVLSSVNADGETHESKPQGMTLRDYFAAQALTGWLAGIAGKGFMDEYEHEDDVFMQHQHEVAKTCYGYADALLKAREA